MRRRPRPLTPRVARLLAGVSFVVACTGAAKEPWGYKLGITKTEQQANFCASAKTVHALADVFEQYGPRTGFSALSDSPDCALALETFTPIRVEKQLILAEGTTDEYTLSFVEVRTQSGARRYLVTSREVSW